MQIHSARERVLGKRMWNASAELDWKQVCNRCWLFASTNQFVKYRMYQHLLSARFLNHTPGTASHHYDLNPEVVMQVTSSDSVPLWLPLNLVRRSKACARSTIVLCCITQLSLIGHKWSLLKTLLKVMTFKTVSTMKLKWTTIPKLCGNQSWNS